MFINKRYKIQLSDITVGSQDPTEVEAFLIAGDLVAQGYRCISNAYCQVARVDREDWLELMAQSRGCTVADFYSLDGSGVPEHHREFYRRSFSEDIHTVHPMVLELMRKSCH